MKLLTKLTNRYLTWSLLVMAVSGTIIYFTLSFIITHQLDERLKENLNTVEEQIAQMPETVFFEPVAKVEKTTNSSESVMFTDTLIFNAREKEYEDYRQISATKKIGEDYYNIVLRKSKIESEDFLAILTVVTILGMLMLWLILLLVTRKLAKSLWLPFFANLKILEQFSITSQQPVQLKETGIFEFDQLNNVTTRLTRQIITDYQNQKQFSEDISHELQTPLAIISSRLESLLGNPALKEHQEILTSIYTSVHRLSRLNKAMILLSKIENNQFASKEQTNLTLVLNEKLKEFSELISLKDLQLETALNADLVIPIPLALAEILVNNLLSNGVNHTAKGGHIKIELSKKQLTVCNSGTKAIPEPEKLFSRFYKVDASSNSVGLGLAIVKKICDLYPISIRYYFVENIHCFEINIQN